MSFLLTSRCMMRSLYSCSVILPESRSHLLLVARCIRRIKLTGTSEEDVKAPSIAMWRNNLVG